MNNINTLTTGTINGLTDLSLDTLTTTTLNSETIDGNIIYYNRIEGNEIIVDTKLTLTNTGVIAVGDKTISDVELTYLDGVSSNIQQQINNIANQESNVQQQINSLKNLKDADGVKNASAQLKALKKLQDVYYKNFIVDLFVQVTTDKVNEQLMMAPISMERFKGVGVDTEESAFDLVARLKGFKEPKPMFKDFTTNELYESALEEWQSKRDKVIYTSRNLYDVYDQMLMHKDNFSGTKLTGSFANMAKVIAYFFQSTSDNKYPALKESYHITLDGKTYEGYDYYEQKILKSTNIDGNSLIVKPIIDDCE
jgi:hypothetical protein